MSKNHEVFRCVPSKHNLSDEDRNKCRPMALQSDKAGCEATGVCVYQGEYGGCRPTTEGPNPFCFQVRTQTSEAMAAYPDSDVRDICNLLSHGKCSFVAAD